MEQGYKFRIYPNEAQEILIAKTLGCCRYVHNYYLNLRKERYATEKKNMGYHACCKDFSIIQDTLNNPYLDKNAGNHQSVAAGILLGCFLADIG